MQPLTSEAHVVNATPQARLRHRHRDLSRLWRNPTGHRLHRRPTADCEDPRACTIARDRGRNSGARSADAEADCIETDMS